MIILVTFKSVFDPDALSVSGTPLPDAKRIINPFDAIAIEEAVRMRERGSATEVVGVTIGPDEIEEQCRVAAAMGVDRVIRIDDSRPHDSESVSIILQAIVDRAQPDIVIMGKQAVDDDAGQTGQMLAGRLGWPHATAVSAIRLLSVPLRIECTRETDYGLFTISVQLPAVLTVDLRLNQPRYVSLAGLIKARRHPIERLTCADIQVRAEPRTTVLRYVAVPRRPVGSRVESVEQLVEKLHAEAKVL